MDPTPLMAQYLGIKKQYPDALLFFRVGDFYEMFFEDAVLASKLLNIALTSRDKSKENPVPLCGIPYHAANNYLVKLISAGYPVAICEQTEDPKSVKGIVRREVVRVVSPGALVEDELLSDSSNNFFASVCAESGDRAGIAYIDISTGEFNFSVFKGEFFASDLTDELTALQPRELLVSERLFSEPRLKNLETAPGWKIRVLSDTAFRRENAFRILGEHFNRDIGLDRYKEEFGPAISAAGALLDYLRSSAKTPLSHVIDLKPVHPENFMMMDQATQRSLELFRNSFNEKKEHSLFGVLDKTQTAMGSRKLKNWMIRPLTRPEEIAKRLDAVEFVNSDYELFQKLIHELRSIQDIERLTSRIAVNRCSGRDLVALKNSILPLKAVQKLFQTEVPPLIRGYLNQWDCLDDLSQLIESSIIEESSGSMREGSLIKPGYSAELEELKRAAAAYKTKLVDLEREERVRTGIDSLKIRFNQVAGYYIEIPKGKAGKAPGHYQRKQTLTNAERYTLPLLLEYEAKIRESEKEAEELESVLFERIRITVAEAAPRVLAMAGIVASLDVISTFSRIARDSGYVRPEITPESVMKIVEGRHPVIEKILPPGQFVPNDLFLDLQHRMMIITGPNMAGKSTVMRQAALIVILAQMGSFVPAKECAVGIVDRLFTRIGAADYLTRGQSTFMVEMTETAHILNTATPNSLIILDEIGRGTSTYDGISIAWSIAEQILKKTGTRTLFATHYLELTGLPAAWHEADNFNISVKEWNDEIVFLRKVTPGIADRSYGIQVARLAGIPSEVIDRAKEILENLENDALDFKGLPKISRHAEVSGEQGLQPDLFLRQKDKNLRAVAETIEQTDLLNLTPMESIRLVHRLRQLLEEKGRG